MHNLGPVGQLTVHTATCAACDSSRMVLGGQALQLHGLDEADALPGCAAQQQAGGAYMQGRGVRSSYKKRMMLGSWTQQSCEPLHGERAPCLEKSPGSWLALEGAAPPRALVALTKLCVPERMLAAVVDTKLDTLLPRLATAS